MKKEVKKPIKKKVSKFETQEVDVHNDAQMVELGIRVPILIPRDKSVWTKTNNEKRLSKTVRRHSKGDGHFHSIPKKIIPVRDNLIIYLKKNKTYNKSTYSIECFQHEIPEIISKYVECNKSGVCNAVVLKYSWNRKTYSPNEIPIW